MNPPPDYIVELREVTKRYGTHTALVDFSLSVRRGEFLTLLGPSGSGKTTVLRLVAGFEEPQAGEILIEGRNASGLPPYRRNVNTVFQHYALFPHLTVSRNVAFGLEQRKLPAAEIRRRVQAMLEMVELPGREDRFPQQLSGGERQRVALARALVLEPAVLLLDEPLGALDQKLRQQMQVELKRLRQRLGITFIFVTHDQEEALVMSDRVAVIHQGCLEQVDTSEEIYERPRTRFVAEFLGVENFLEARRVAQTKDGTCFETAAGLPLWAADSRVGSPGSAATVAVRPESLRMSLAPPEPRPLNLIEAQVVEAIYEGGSRRWTLTLPGDMRLVAREANSSSALPTTGLAGGTKVYISWELCKSLVYPREGQA